MAFSSCCCINNCIAGGERLDILVTLGQWDWMKKLSCDVRVGHGFGKANVMDNTNGRGNDEGCDYITGSSLRNAMDHDDG